MKITIVCANGRAGKLILEEAVSRGHEVTAIVRNNRDLPDTVNVIENEKGFFAGLLLCKKSFSYIKFYFTQNM
ncbi:MAG: NAD(P)H-binding protein [Eubacterium sp.]|nr:NAD(P)H-binding protein [Eubacterium sp.]